MTSVNTARESIGHPLDQGHAPRWASGWGQDRRGVFVEITVGVVVQRMRWIRPGRYLMGSPDGSEEGVPAEPGRFGGEGPQHEVPISRGFWLFDTPVTQELWMEVMGENPSNFQTMERPLVTRRHPVESVSWKDAQEFLRRVDERLPGVHLTLPTEAQWEYACRAGTKTPTYAEMLWKDEEPGAAILDRIAWWKGNSEGTTHEVRQRYPNHWGLYDMLGNVYEWCQDEWHLPYESSPSDERGWEHESAVLRVLRGGDWISEARNVRAASRKSFHPEYRNDTIGFRLSSLG